MSAGPAGRVQPGGPARALARRQRRHAFGFWAVTLAFLLNMGFSAVPTPLYVLYQQRDHFSTITLTVVYAVYAVGVIASLFLGGHVSDWIGRKRVLVPALLVNAACAVIFLLAPSLPGLLVARVISGVSVGLTTATATAYLGELHHGTRRGSAGATGRAQIVATAANLGGIGVGPLAAGLLAQYAPHPLVLPYLVFLVALVVLAVLVALAPETADLPDPAPRYRPQRIAVPDHARRAFYAAAATGMASFAVFGIFTSLVPSFLSSTLHQTSHAVAGAVAFAAFASGALAQIAFSRVSLRTTLTAGPLLLIPGLALLATGMWLSGLTLFVLGGVVAGAGGGLLFRGALGVAASTAEPHTRAEVLAAFFLASYIGLSVPVVGLGIATHYAPARDVMPVFAALVAAAVLLCTRTATAHRAAAAPDSH